MTGRFITLEGGEGVGKSTQAHQLANSLQARGIDVVVTREPGGTPGAEAIRELLMSGDEDRWSARAEALLFAAARADHVEKVIRPAMDRGAWVISDRYIDSTRAYQGGAGGVADDDIMSLHRFGSGGLMPDRTILLRMPVGEAAERAIVRDNGVGDRIGGRELGYHARLSSAFDEIAAREHARIRIIDASGDTAQVADRVLAALSDLW